MNNSKIDLHRMSKLLNESNSKSIIYSKDIQVEPNNNEMKKVQRNLKIDTSDSDINLNHIDIENALSHAGKVFGFNNIVRINDLHYDVLKNIPIEHFNNAQIILYSFFVSEDLTLIEMNDLLEAFHEKVIEDSNAELIFGITQLKDLKVNEVGYRILLTGIKDETNEKLTDPDLIYHRQLYNENHLLKDKINRLELKIKKLEAQKNRLETSLLSLR